MSFFKHPVTNKLVPQIMFSWVLSIAVVACSQNATHGDSSTVTDLGGSWNDTDSRLVAQEMVQDVLSRRWLTSYISKNGKKPTVIVGAVRNLSHEQIDTLAFISDIERELVNSGKVEFIAFTKDREQERGERPDEDLNASDAMRKLMEQEAGADFILQGSINTVVDAIEGEQARFYQIDLNLIDIATNRKVWVGQKKIKKTIEKSGIR